MEQVSILFTGDIYPSEEIRLSRELQDHFLAADYRIGNLECVMGDFDFSNSVGGKTVLKSISADCVEFLKSMNMDHVALANNHMFDFGVDGFRKNTEILTSAGISYSGAGENLDLARQPHIFEKNGIKVAIVTCAWSGTEAQYADEKTPGCAPFDEKYLLEILKSLKDSGVDHVILYVHWGYCGYPCPLPEHKKTAETLIRNGYSAIIGHHHHQLNGKLVVDDRLIMFGLGDFVFAPHPDIYGKMINPGPLRCRSLVCTLILDKNGIVADEVFFTLYQNDEIRANNTPQAKKEFENLSKMLLATPYEKLWKSIVRRRLMRRSLYWLNPLNWKNIKLRTFNALLIMLRNLWKKDLESKNV